MKSFVLFLALTISTLSYAKNLENVLIGPGQFPTQPNDFIKCVSETGLAGSGLQFVGVGSVNLLSSDSSRIEVKVLAKDSRNQSGFFKIIVNSNDNKLGWQKIYAAKDNIFYFSKSVSSVALLATEGAEVAHVFDFGTCENP